MPLVALPSSNISGYTGLNVYGAHAQMTEVLAAQTLAGGDVTLTDDQGRTIGLIEVTTGHATNAFIVPNLAGKFYWIVNNHASLAANIKVASTTAISVAATKSALVYVTSAGACKRLTADT
jgi:hypothetical protein